MKCWDEGGSVSLCIRYPKLCGQISGLSMGIASRPNLPIVLSLDERPKRRLVIQSSGARVLETVVLRPAETARMAPCLAPHRLDRPKSRESRKYRGA